MNNPGKHLSFPFRIAPDGRMASNSTTADQVRDELVQLVLTNPGERLNLPDFGGGVRLLLFENSDPAMLGLVKARITQSVAAWMAGRVTIVNLELASREGTVEVTLSYRLAGSDQVQELKFQRTNPA